MADSATFIISDQSSRPIDKFHIVWQIECNAFGHLGMGCLGFPANGMSD